MECEQYGFDTLQLHAGQTPDAQTGARAVPIYQSSSFCYGSAEECAGVFSGERPGYTYTRIINPTVEVLEKRLAALEQGAGCVCFASGMAAIMACVAALCRPGDEIVTMSALYGGTYTLFAQRMKDILGVTARFVDADRLEELESAINARTRLVYIETIGNPSIVIPDIRAVASVAHRHGLPLAADNTFGTPYLITVKDHGVDISIHSLTKYIGGHGNAIGGAVVDMGTFNYRNPRFPHFTIPDKTNHGTVYADLDAPLARLLRAQLIRDFGACLSPFDAFLFLNGLETLSLRVERHVRNTLQIAAFLQNHPRVAYVNYPGLETDAYHARALQYFPRGAGAILAFGVKGGLEEGRRFLNRVKLFSIVANVADAKSLVIHPASSTHGQLSDAERAEAGVKPEMIRVSVGLEDIKDLIADLDRALS